MCLLIKAVEEKNCHLAFTWAERLELNSKADQTLFASIMESVNIPLTVDDIRPKRWKDSRKKIIVSIF